MLKEAADFNIPSKEELEAQKQNGGEPIKSITGSSEKVTPMVRVMLKLIQCHLLLGEAKSVVDLVGECVLLAPVYRRRKQR